MANSDVLPIPEPDWDNPEPSDAPEQEETAAYAGLVKLRDGLTEWLAATGGQSLRPVEWRQMVAILNAAAGRCVLADTDHIAHHIRGQIVVQPHTAVPQDGVCVRCDLPVGHTVHVIEHDTPQEITQ
ncbi:hypothetical protein ALI144C_44775 [Actinosynnema sp. ALI-1.44]|nr:hypothetical protein ALI144C_44775 [Actinosynnema sp. ALI-1.44]